jgi:hypothetical protein
VEVKLCRPAITIYWCAVPAICQPRRTINTPSSQRGARCSSGGGRDDAPHRAPEPVRAARPHSGGRVGHVPTPLVVDHRHALACRGDRGLSRGVPILNFVTRTGVA